MSDHEKTRIKVARAGQKADTKISKDKRRDVTMSEFLWLGSEWSNAAYVVAEKADRERLERALRKACAESQGSNNPGPREP